MTKIQTIINKWKAIGISSDEIEQALLEAYNQGKDDKHREYEDDLNR